MRLVNKIYTSNVTLKYFNFYDFRLVYASEDNAFIVHRMENSRVYEGRPEVTLEFPLEVISNLF